MDAIKPDADNVIPRREPIDPNGPAAYWTRLPLRSILNDFADVRFGHLEFGRRYVRM